MPLRRAGAALVLLACCALARDASAEPDAPPPRLGALPYARFVGTALFGSGLRFNNPYRLATPLGHDAESISRTAAYVDFGLGVLLGAPEGIQHGPALRATFAVEGVRQAVLTPTYAACRTWGAVQPCARIGLPLVLQPNANVGGELALGASYFVRAGIGLTAELVGDLFYGAATREASYPAYPVLSAQAGIVVALEALP